MTNYSFEIYHTQELRTVCTVLYVIGTCLSVPIFISLCYLVTTKSFLLGEFKYYILQTACINLFYSILLLSWIPIPLFPCFAGFGAGWLSNFGSIGSYIAFIMVTWTLLQTGLKIYIVFLERVVIITSKNHIKIHWK